MNIVILNLYSNSHHLPYAGILSKAFMELGHHVTAVCPESHEVKRWLSANSVVTDGTFRHITFDSPSLRVHVRNPILSGIQTYKRWKSVSGILGNAQRDTGRKIDLVFFSYLDSFLHGFISDKYVEWTFPFPWSGIYFNPWHLRSGRRHIYSLIRPFNRDHVFRSKYCRSVFLLDKRLIPILKNKIRKNSVYEIPDFIDTAPPDTNYKPIPEIVERAMGRKIIGLVGIAQKRKGIMTFLEVAEKSVSENWFFIVAGGIDESTFSEKELEKLRFTESHNPENLYMKLDYIPNESSFNAVINICNILFAAYEGFQGSSNLLTKGAFFRKPIIVTKDTYMSELLEEYDMGETMIEGDADSCIHAIRKILEEDEQKHRGYGFERYYRKNSHAELKNSLRLAVVE